MGQISQTGHIVQAATALKLVGGAALLGLGAFRAAAAAAAAFSSSFFAARSAAALLVRGAILGGAPTLLGRGLGFVIDAATLLERGAGFAAGVDSGAALDVAGFRVGFGWLAIPGFERAFWPITDDARLPTAYREGVALTEACEGGLGATGLAGLSDDDEVDRESVCVFSAALRTVRGFLIVFTSTNIMHLHMKEVGGA